MTTKILFVDDERPLLNAIERRLGDDFEITTADSGAKGLDALLTAGPFPVVFTDMRMPRMDGVEFTERARHIAPESTFIMLTGNQDQTTVVSALNRGRVFRFLNKPCNSEDLRNAIRDGLRQYELVTAERELMLKTFLGSVNILTDVLELAHPQIAGQVDDVGFKVNLLRLAGGIDDRWEFRLAARLALVGYSLLPDSKYQLLSQPAVSASERNNVLEEAPQITGRLLRDVPRLETLSKLFTLQPKSQGAIATIHPAEPDEIVQVGATLLRAGTHWHFLANQGRDVDSIAAELNSIMPELPEQMLHAVQQSCFQESPNSNCVELDRDELRVGMITGCEIKGDDGATLVNSGVRLNESMIERLFSYPSLLKVQVAETAVIGN